MRTKWSDNGPEPVAQAVANRQKRETEEGDRRFFKVDLQSRGSSVGFRGSTLGPSQLLERRGGGRWFRNVIHESGRSV